MQFFQIIITASNIDIVSKCCRLHFIILKNIYGYFTIRVSNIIGNYLVKFMNTSGVPFTT